MNQYEEKKNSLKDLLKSKSLIFVNIIAYVIAIASILVDIKFGFDNVAISNFVAIMYPTVITVAGFLITIYVLFLEIYKDRYPFENMQKKHFPNTRKYLSAIIYNVILGCAALCIGKGLVSFVLFCLTSIATVVSIIVVVSRSNKSLALTSYIEDFCDDINSDFKENKSTVSLKTVKNIKNVLDECVTKEEYHTVGIVVEKTGDIFRAFLENSIAISADGNNSSTAVVDTFDRIIGLNMFELDLCKSIKSKQLIKKIVWQQHKNLCFCIENHQMEWYEKYFKEYLKYLYKIQNENIVEVANLIYLSFSGVVQCLYKNEKEKCAEDTLREIDNANVSFVRINKKGNAKIYIQFLCGSIDYAIKEKNDKLLDLLIEIIGEYSYTLVRNSNSFTEIIEYHKWIFDLVLNYSTDKAIMLYERCDSAFSYNSMQTPVLIECNMFCLNRLIEKDRSEKKNQEKFIEYYLDLLYQVSKAKEKYTGYLFFLDFESMIEENRGNAEKINKTTSYMKKLLNQCILGDNIPLFYEFVVKINSVITKTQSKDKFVQEGLFSVYFWLINRTHQLVNKQFLEIVFFNLDTVIEELDNNRAISEGVGEYIINNLHMSCQSNMFHNGDCSIEIIDMLSDFLEERNPRCFVAFKPELKKLLCKTLFNIGTDCVENGFEEGVRCVSNSLGWLTINSIKQGSHDLTIYLIERASELYNISVTMDISHKTRMFMLTLFPTVGAFCCDGVSRAKYCNLIIDAIKNEPQINVETAVRLRTSENDMWNTLYDGKTDELTKKFMDKYRKAVGDSDVIKEAKRIMSKK